VIVGSDPAVGRFTARDGEIVSEAGTVVAREDYFGWGNMMMNVIVARRSTARVRSGTATLSRKRIRTEPRSSSRNRGSLGGFA
jgi:hypothetical protein